MDKREKVDAVYPIVLVREKLGHGIPEELESALDRLVKLIECERIQLNVTRRHSYHLPECSVTAWYRRPSSINYSAMAELIRLRDRRKYDMKAPFFFRTPVTRDSGLANCYTTCCTTSVFLCLAFSSARFVISSANLVASGWFLCLRMMWSFALVALVAWSWLQSPCFHACLSSGAR